ncbi:MAG: hypothetical protein KDH94_02880, partial [Coxiellaceae bacterium]|nr:hypothetical protein [Coxiellaceae bacterium]
SAKPTDWKSENVYKVAVEYLMQAFREHFFEEYQRCSSKGLELLEEQLLMMFYQSGTPVQATEQIATVSSPMLV